MKVKSKFGKVAVMFAVSALVALVFGAGYVFADGVVVPDYTGCLKQTGQPLKTQGVIYGVAEGSSPLFDCDPGDLQIRISGGDITAVYAGQGLVGGGVEGDLSVGLQDSYALPQGCLDTQVAKWDAVAMSWYCGPDDNNQYVAGSGLLLSAFELSADPAYLQRRVSGECAPGESIRTINGDGTVVCQVSGSSYTAGPGLALSNNEFSLADGGVTAEKIAVDSVSAQHLNLLAEEKYLGGNIAINITSSYGLTIGQTILSYNLQPGTYMIYGLAQAYVDQAADVDGGIIYVINDGTNVLRDGPQFYFTKAAGWLEMQSSGFNFVITLTQPTTLNLAAYKGPGAITTGVAGGGTRFGYIKIAE